MRRRDAFLGPVGDIAQRLLEDPRIGDDPRIGGSVALLGVVALVGRKVAARRNMQGIVDIPDAVLVVVTVTEDLADLLPVPVGLPGIGGLVHEAVHGDHLAVENAALIGVAFACLVVAREQWSLRIDRFAVGCAELVPDVELFRRVLVAVVGLRREVIGIVDFHRVALRHLPEHRDVLAAET